MSLALSSDVRFNPGRSEASSVLQAGKITGLEAPDRQILLDWLDGAGANGIDIVVDLAVRPWHIDGAQAIIGVFKKDQTRASWLMIRHQAGWVLVWCDDGSISDVSPALPDILALIDVNSA